VSTNEFDFSIFEKPLRHDNKGRYYLPMSLYRGAPNKEIILVAGEVWGKEMLYSYKVHINKDGSYWIKGNNIAKCWNFDSRVIPSRLFLEEELVEKLESL
jgi:hypothetical protein